MVFKHLESFSIVVIKHLDLRIKLSPKIIPYVLYVCGRHTYMYC